MPASFIREDGLVAHRMEDLLDEVPHSFLYATVRRRRIRMPRKTKRRGAINQNILEYLASSGNNVVDGRR